MVKGRYSRKRAKIGDVAEFTTALGLAYAQYTHEHPQFTSVLRVFEGFHPERPQDLQALVAGPILFETLMAFKWVANVGAVNVVGNVPVPEERRAFPLFRAAVNRDPKTGLSSGWWLWDGESEWRAGELTPEQRNLPNRSVPSYPLFIAWIEEQRRNRDISPSA